MAKLYGEIDAKALLTLDKSFARANGQPLDASEVYYSLADAQTYAATAQAYIGQKIVVVEEGVVTHYGIEDAAGNLKELGAKPVGDESSIVVATDGTISLKGIDTLSFERDILDENGEATGEKEAIQYQPLMTAAGLIWVEPSKTTVEGLATLIEALTVRVKSAEDAIDAIEADYLKAADKTELSNAISAEAEAARAAEKALGERIDGINYVDADDYEADKIVLNAAIEAAKQAGDNAQATIDAFLTSEEVDDTVNTLKEIKAEIEKMTDATELATALSNKADLSYVNEELAKKQDVIAENTYDAYGAAATAKSEAITEAANAAANLYVTKTTFEEFETDVDERLDALELYEHSTYATKDELSGVSNIATDAQNRVGIVEGKIDEITSVGGEPNVLEKIKVNGVTLEIEKDSEGKSTKTVSFNVPTKFSDVTDDSGFDARITAAQNAADAAQSTANTANSAAAQAQREIDALEIVVGNLTNDLTGNSNTLTDYGTRIGALEQADITHATEYSTLNSIVSGHTETIAQKADLTALNEAIAKISANETAIKTINETTIPAVNTEIAKKANASDVYTKNEVNAITGTVAEGKTIVKMIEEAQSAATYDDTEVRELINDNVAAIETIYSKNGDAAATGILATEIARVEGLVSTETGRAQSAESALSGRLDTVEAFWKEALRDGDEKNVIDTLKEIQEYIETDESGASAMAANIQSNETAIKAIYTSANGDTPASGVLVTEIARVEDKINTNAQAITAINNETNGILAQSKSYTDTQIAGLPAATAEKLGLVKVDNATIKADNGVISVKAISTDLLTQGVQTLVLNGGSASEQQ